MIEFFNDHGILFQYNGVSTPQQNGVAERKHKHILNGACTLRFQSHLPLTFWGESVLTDVYLINCTPTPLLSHKTPFEILYKQSPTYDHLRVFGYLCFATDMHPEHKFINVPANAFLFAIVLAKKLTRFMI